MHSFGLWDLIEGILNLSFTKISLTRNMAPKKGYFNYRDQGFLNKQAHKVNYISNISKKLSIKKLILMFELDNI